MERMKIFCKPLSVNEAWQGRRFKTDKYLKFERDMLFLLPAFKLPNKPYKISLVFGMSNSASDIDNPAKTMIDVLQKKYGFNDRDVFELHIIKNKTEKGKEFIEFEIDSL